MNTKNDCDINEILNQIPLSEKVFELENFAKYIRLYYAIDGTINKKAILKMKSLLQHIETIDLE